MASASAALPRSSAPALEAVPIPRNSRMFRLGRDTRSIRRQAIARFGTKSQGRARDDLRRADRGGGARHSPPRTCRLEEG